MQKVPSAVAQVYTAEVLGALAAIERPPAHPADHQAEPIRLRHIVFSGDAVRGLAFSALRKAWWAYIEHAHAVGLLDRDLLRRLTSTDDEAFRGALAECRTSWFFAGKLGIRLHRHAGAGGDFDDGSQLRVEVKAPYVPLQSNAWAGDDSDALAKCIKRSGEQFDEGKMNVLIICPLIRTPVWMQRDQIVKASLGEWAISVPVSLDGSEPGEPRPVFWQNGKLARMFPTGEGEFSPDHRRVSAVVTIEEAARPGPEGLVIHHLSYIVHNPFAAVRLAETTFAGHPQLVLRDAGMSWLEI